MQPAIYQSSLLQDRLDLFTCLEDELEQAQAALLRRDLKGLEVHTARQRELCLALQRPFSDPALDTQEDTAPSEHRATLLAELDKVAVRIRYLNRVHAALLARAGRSLAILERVLASAAVTYTSGAEGVSVKK